MNKSANKVTPTTPKRNSDGRFKQVRGDTKIQTIEKRYGKDFGVRSDKKLQTHLTEMGLKSLSELLKTSAKPTANKVK